MDSSAVLCLVVLVGAVFVVAASNNSKQKALQEAHRNYQEALARLKQHPYDPNLKQTALNFGRAYSNLTRNKKGITIFDEMALMNDLNAATAGASQQHVQYAPPPVQAAYVPAPSTQSLSPEDRLRKLDGLKTQGLISDDEYNARRAKILDEL